MTQTNLKAAYEQSSSFDRELGQTAYQTYQKGLKLFADYYDISFINTVEAFVALSPNNDYIGNLRSLSSLMYAHKNNIPITSTTISTYKACGIRAMSYLDGSVSFSDTVKGLKISAFRDNILYLTKSKRVTIDGHMVALYFNKNITMKQAAFLLRNQYRIIERDFISCARNLSLPPTTLQATLWFYRKRTLAIKFNTQLELFSGQSKHIEIPTPENYPPYPYR